MSESLHQLDENAAAPRRSNERLSWPQPRVERWLLAAYVLVVIGVASTLSFRAMTEPPTELQSVIRWTPIGWSPSILMSVTWGCGVLMLAATPFYPAVGLFVYVALIHGVARYRPELEYAYLNHFHEWIMGLSLLGWILWRRRQEHPHPISNDPLTKVLAALLVWISISTGVALSLGEYFPIDPKHTPLRFACAGIGFLIAATSISLKRDLVGLAACLLFALWIRDRHWPEVTYLDGDLPALAVIAFPLALSAAWSCRNRLCALGLIIGSLSMTWLLYTTNNRAAGVAFAVALLALWIGSQRKVLTIIVATPILAIFGIWFRTTSYWDRFANQIYKDGRFIGSAESRLEIWENGWQLFRDCPYFGSGPGTFARRLQIEDPQIGNYMAHNSFFEMLVETGIPGVVLYTIFFVLAIVLAYKTRSRDLNDYTTAAAVALAAAITAYLTTALFLSRHDLPLAYIVVGFVVALRRPTVERFCVRVLDDTKSLPIADDVVVPTS